MEFQIIPVHERTNPDLESVRITGLDIPTNLNVDVLGTIFSTVKDIAAEVYDSYYTMYPCSHRVSTTDPFELQFIISYAPHAVEVEKIDICEHCAEKDCENCNQTLKNQKLREKRSLERDIYESRCRGNFRKMLYVFEQAVRMFSTDPDGLNAFMKHVEENPDEEAANQSRWLKERRDMLMIRHNFRTTDQVKAKHQAREAHEAMNKVGARKLPKFVV